MVKSLKIFLILSLLIVVINTTAVPHQLGALFNSYKLGDTLDLERLEFIDKGGFDLKKHLKKKYVLLLFWSHYFEHDHDTLNLCSRLYSHYKNREIAFLGVNLDSNWKKVEKLVKKFDLDFPHTYNPYLTFPCKLLGAISQTGGSIVVIDKEGKIALLWQLVNEEDYNEIRHFLDRNLLRAN